MEGGARKRRERLQWRGMSLRASMRPHRSLTADAGIAYACFAEACVCARSRPMRPAVFSSVCVVRNMACGWVGAELCARWHVGVLRPVACSGVCFGVCFGVCSEKRARALSESVSESGLRNGRVWGEQAMAALLRRAFRSLLRGAAQWIAQTWRGFVQFLSIKGRIEL
eukprot:3912469-Rhodomonas_salina.1